MARQGLVSSCCVSLSPPRRVQRAPHSPLQQLRAGRPAAPSPPAVPVRSQLPVPSLPRGLAWYRAQMPFTLPRQLTVEKTPGYFSSPEVPARVWDMNPAVRLLLIVRDPAERLVSDYTQVLHNRLARNKPYQTLEELLLGPEGRIDPAYKALQRSLYHQHLARWLEVFPRKQVHVVDGEALVQDPFPELQRAERFLELPPRISPSNFYFNTTKGFYCLVAAGGHDKCLDESKGRPHAPLSAQAFRKLCRYFREANRMFFDMVGHS